MENVAFASELLHSNEPARNGRWSRVVKDLGWFFFVLALVEHRQSAYLYVPSPAGLAGALEDVLTDGDLAGALGRGGRTRMVEHWWQARRPEVLAQPAWA